MAHELTYHAIAFSSTAEKKVENRVRILKHSSYLVGGMVTVAEYEYRQVGATGQSSWLLAVR